MALWSFPQGQFYIMKYLFCLLSLVLPALLSGNDGHAVSADDEGDLIVAVEIISAEEAAQHRAAVMDSVSRMDSISPTIHRLTEEDYREVAAELGVEVAAIKAVVDIEAGKAHKGFHEPGKALVNFDLSMFRRFASRKGINLSKYQKSHSTVFTRPNVKVHGSYQRGQQVRLAEAMKINRTAAIEGTFWGMFQVGGFNWKKCGTDSIEDFYRRVNSSEREQLELFAQFIKSTGLVKYLASKNWAAFARGYNGPGYARHAYHTRLANAYARHRKEYEN